MIVEDRNWHFPLLLATISIHVLVINALATPDLLSDSPTALTSPAANLSADAKMRITCDANSYGQNLKVPSCKKIFNLVEKDDRQITFADRASLVPKELPLPYRLQSG